MADIASTDSEFLADLKQYDEFYCSLVDLIPPDNFGFDEDVKDKLKNYKHTSIEAKLKEYEKDRLSAAGRQVISRLDYAQPKTVTDIWKFLDQQRLGASTSKGGHFKNKPLKRKLGGDKKDVNGAISQDNTGFSLADKQQAKRKSKKSGPPSTDGERQHLLVKLQKKLEELRKKRDGTGDGGTVMKKREKNLQRRMKKVQVDSGNKVKGAVSNDASPEKDDHIVKNSNFKKIKVDDKSQKKVIKNSEGQIVYSKFDFAVTGLRKEDLKNKETETTENRGALKRKREFAGKDYKKLLEKVEQNEQKLAGLKEKDSEQAAKVENNRKWEKALEKAEGVKVKDDKKMLKMNMKRKEKQKNQTKQEWNKRYDNVKAKMAKRQEKRYENLKVRSDQKKARKIEKAKKKGRIAIP